MKPSSGVPKFLTKIWALVEDPKTDKYICWSRNGYSFIVLDEESFAKNILPKHFKHNNMASFVRQLNWYGFRKVMHDESGSAKQERYGPGKYQHPFFKQGQEELLSKIKRKVPLPRLEDGKIGSDDVHKILALIHQVQGRQDIVESAVESLKRENEALRKEVLDLRQKHNLHQQQFDTMVPLQSYSPVISLQQTPALMIDSTGNYNAKSIQKTVDIHQVFGNRPKRAVNGDKPSELRSGVAIKEEQPESSEEDKARISTREAEGLGGCYLDGMENDSELVSSETEEMGRADAASSSMCSNEACGNSGPESLPSTAKLSSSISFKAEPLDKGQVTTKRQDRISEVPAHQTERVMDNSGPDSEIEDCWITNSDSGHMRKRRKMKESSSGRIGHLLNQMHKESVGLTERVLAVEEQSLQKLSEISATLSALTSCIVNSQPLQKSFQLPSQTMGGTHAPQIPSQIPQGQYVMIWPQNSAVAPERSMHPN
ncbi:heat shock factor protein 2-like isoform X1 [Rhinatrema bivittatum]|uniref:heat shock factor protein 2-like isoform X1 n=1 Tax=Rhinatrema bivittatum TaxID=194408 RepID=UPI00112E256B|nr:heat shock factor protein 2-like isoform X1 [Rhinatrema bivittatum]